VVKKGGFEQIDEVSSFGQFKDIENESKERVKGKTDGGVGTEVQRDRGEREEGGIGILVELDQGEIIGGESDLSP